MSTIERQEKSEKSEKSEKTQTPESIKTQRFKTLLETTLGPIILKHLYDDKVIEIMLNPDGHLVIDYLGGDKVVRI